MFFVEINQDMSSKGQFENGKNIETLNEQTTCFLYHLIDLTKNLRLVMH